MVATGMAALEALCAAAGVDQPYERSPRSPSAGDVDSKPQQDERNEEMRTAGGAPTEYTSSSNCPACRGRHRAHTCSKAKDRKESGMRAARCNECKHCLRPLWKKRCLNLGPAQIQKLAKAAAKASEAAEPASPRLTVGEPEGSQTTTAADAAEQKNGQKRVVQELLQQERPKRVRVAPARSPFLRDSQIDRIMRGKEAAGVHDQEQIIPEAPTDPLASPPSPRKPADDSPRKPADDIVKEESGHIERVDAWTSRAPEAADAEP